MALVEDVGTGSPLAVLGMKQKTRFESGFFFLLFSLYPFLLGVYAFAAFAAFAFLFLFLFSPSGHVKSQGPTGGKQRQAAASIGQSKNKAAASSKQKQHEAIIIIRQLNMQMDGCNTSCIMHHASCSVSCSVHRACIIYAEPCLYAAVPTIGSDDAVRGAWCVVFVGLMCVYLVYPFKRSYRVFVFIFFSVFQGDFIIG